MREVILLTDGYKLDHRRQYPEGTEYVYSNWTPRSCHYYPEASEGTVVFGIQYFIKEYLMKQFQQNFFDKPKGVAQLLGFHYPDRERHIYVTHMVNPKGITTLSENYKKVYFTNSYKDWDNEVLPNNVEVIKVV